MMIRSLSQAYDLQRAPGEFVLLAHRKMMRSIEHRQFHVLKRSGARQQVEPLEHKADLLIPDISQFIAVQFRNVRLIKQIRSLGGAIQAATIFIRVDFPEPLAPITATNSPGAICSDTPRTACTST